MNNNLRGVYLITDTSIQTRFTHLELTEMAVEAGVHLVQYRDKKRTARQALAEIEEISELTRQTETKLIVNDRADLALAGGADGVHLGQDDLPIEAARDLLGSQKLIGGTSSTLEEALRVQQLGADYVALGHIFETSTKKKEYPPRGLVTLRRVADTVSIPLVAIGGITLENAPEVIDAGADIIALSSAICAAEDLLKAAKEFVAIFD
ncbi:MAG: thiamine phosphate synthase [Balneolaceae bacterium]|nr:thiamine phosphate synthase [Balneolaceae bacterium]